MFSSFGLSKPVVKAVAELGYTEPTPVQAQAIPAVLDGRDLLAGAQTGTGKTAGFVLPILTLLYDRINGQPRPKGKYPIRALILTPTRELAAQVEQSVVDYGQYLPLKSAVVVGGVSIKPQIRRLQGQVDVLVATPGRLLDHVQQGTVSLDKIEIFVLDEADRMLDMGFIRDIRKIMDLLPKKRQNLLFSATFSKEIRGLANNLLTKPVMIQVAAENVTADTVKQSVYVVDKARKRELLAKLIKHYDWYRVLVFTRTKHGANRLVKQLGIDGIEALAIHGNKTQGARTRALKEFKEGQIQALVATDVAARGIDIAELEMVVNYELPNVPEDYIHRIGRTGRAGLSGEALSLVCGEEAKLLRDIEKTIGREIDRETMEGFEPREPFSTARTAGNTGPSGSRGRGGGGGGGGGGGRSAKRGKKKTGKKAAGRKVTRTNGADDGPGRKRSSKKKSASRQTGQRAQSGGPSGNRGRKKTTQTRRQFSD